MKILQVAKTTPKDFSPKSKACDHDCLAVCKKCPPKTC